MKKVIVLFTVLMLCVASCDTPQIRLESKTIPTETTLDREIRRVVQPKMHLEERRRQVPAIVAAFAKWTTPQRARHLGMLCYLKTLGTPLMPIDLAEIALAETGSHGLSAKAVSSRGALGVWQIMPSRAISHGYTPEDMKNDERCAEAAVLELRHKMKIARGNLHRAKKLYCGVGPQANAYEVKRMQFRKEILKEVIKYPALHAGTSYQVHWHPS